MTVVSELCDPLDGHATTVAAWLSGTIPKRTIAEDVHNGITIDQVIAKQIGQDTVFPSIELATEDFTGYIGGCDTAYACAYMNTLSWASPTQPLPMEINPRVTFERMFGRAGTAEQRLARMQNDKSILDSVQQDVKDLQGGLGPKDRGPPHATTSRTCARSRSASSGPRSRRRPKSRCPTRRLACRSRSRSTSGCSSTCSRSRSKRTSRRCSRSC